MEGVELQANIKQPFRLEPHQEWICNYLDRLDEKKKICSGGVLPSSLIQGALAVIYNKELNPDWMAQSAHSFREILYGLGGTKNNGFYLKIKLGFYFWLSRLGFKNKTVSNFVNLRTKKQNIENILQALHEQRKAQIIADILYKIYLAFTNICHHFSKKNSKQETIKIFNKLGINIIIKDFPSTQDFNNLVQLFEKTLRESSLDPLKIHEKINNLIQQNNKDASELRLLFSLNYDAKRYFFSQISESWIDWLWQEGFLDEIKKKSKDPTKLFYRLPELDYLTRMAEKEPAKICKIILKKDVATKETKFNPEVVDRFLWIISTDTFPVEQTKILTAKIRDEKWVYLMRNFRKSGYEFKRIIKKLVEKKESNSILELAQALLVIKNKEEILGKVGNFGIDKDPFCANDLDASGIFEALADIEEPYVEQALQITTDIMAEIVKLSEKDDTRIFEYTDSFSLYDVDFFTLEIENENSYSFREDIKNLAATIKKLIERTIGKKCNNEKEAKKLFVYIDNLPSCRSMWRLRLFALSQCPEVFKTELKDAFFRVFEVGERYFEIEGGAEYHQALIHGFKVLDKEIEQREYVKKVFEYFGAELEDKDKEKWRKQEGFETLSYIQKYLTAEEKTKTEEIFERSLDKAEFKPEPSVGKIQSGFVSHKSPIDNINTLSIDKIVENLKSEWTPEKLSEKFKNDNFFEQRGVEGLGDDLKEDLKKRTDDYLKVINLFFDKKNICSHYLYSILRGIEEMLRNKQALSFEQISKVLGLFESVRKEGETTPFERRANNDSWLADWIEVHKVMVDILLFILQNKDEKDKVHQNYREQIKNLISYLFTIPDPIKEHETPEYGEPYHVAINSVRGRAYEAFVVFTENDGKVLAEDIKQIYKKVLIDDSLAVHFVIGRYLASFYFRDKEFITKLFPEIFSKDDPNKKDIYLATWEGYLSNVLYDKLFIALGDYYKHAIEFNPKEYTERKYSKGLDESLAIHIALAFIHFDMDFKHPLFTQFWDISNETRHYEFVSFIGRSCLTIDRASDEWLKEKKISKNKLLTFWDWLLKKEFEPKTYSGFGLWINQNKEVLSEKSIIERLPRTLEKSQGDLDWDYGFTRRLEKFAEIDPKNTLKCIELYLLTSEGNLNPHRGMPMFSIDKEIKDALSICYKNSELKKSVEDLINKLIEKGSSIFWGLKDVI